MYPYCMSRQNQSLNTSQLQGNAAAPEASLENSMMATVYCKTLGRYVVVHKPKKHAERLITMIQGTSISYLEKAYIIQKTK